MLSIYAPPTFSAVILPKNRIFFKYFSKKVLLTMPVGYGIIVKITKKDKKTMDIIILDMEWNQPLYSGMTVTEPVLLHGEVVQIGAVKLNERLETVDTFNLFISPKYYKKMHRKVQKLTKITVDILQSGIPFPEAAEDFFKWCGEDSVILTWGPDDIPMLRDNMVLHGLDTQRIPPSYNLQIIFDAQITKEHRQVALGRALETLGEVGEDAHNALNDAKNTAIVCRHLDLTAGIESYSDLCTDFLTPNADDTDVCDTPYTSKKDVLKDNDIISFECPECKETAVCCDFVRQNAAKTLAMSKCKCKSEYFVRFKFIRTAEGTLKVKRAIYPMNDEYREFYKQRKEINKSFSRSRKKKTL